MGLISHSVSTTSTQDDASNDDCDVELTSLHHGEAHAAATKEPRRKKLNVATLAVLVFYSVSGGPYGSEASVRSAGNFYTLVGYIVAPCIWSIPEAIMTAELSSALPEAAGGVAWVEEAFGERAGWMAGYLGWIAGATDNAIYPVLFLDYLVQALGRNELAEHPITRFLLLAVAASILGYINWLGLDIVGKMSFVICIIAMSPFVILSLVGAFQVDPSRWLELPIDTSGDEPTLDASDLPENPGFLPFAASNAVMWRPFLNNLFWNLNSFDSAASFAADVDNPATVIPKAMFYSVLIVIVGYFVPLLVALGASNSNQNDWVDGYFANVAEEVVGKWLGDYIILAAGVSNIALFQAELSTDAFQLMGMAERGHVPTFFSHRSLHGTPTYGIVFGTLVIIVMGAANLDELIEMLNFNYAIALLMEYCAFIKLRISRPEMHRPWKMPLNTFGCLILFMPTFMLTLIVMYMASAATFGFSVAVNMFGLFLYWVRRKSTINKPDAATYESVSSDAMVAEKYEANLECPTLN